MNKKLIIIIVVAGLLSFAGTFIFVWLTQAPSQEQSSQADQTVLAKQEPEQKLPQPQVPVSSNAIGATDKKMKKTMMEKQLKNLIFEVREKIQEYSSKLTDIELREQRLQVVQNTLKKDIEELDNLRIELASAIAKLKSEQDRLEKSRIEIAKVEKNNLISIAATYDKMDPVAAGSILTNMSKTKNDEVDDAVKILHYMTERTKAKLLAELAASEPKLAAYFCKRLKQVIERE